MFKALALFTALVFSSITGTNHAQAHNEEQIIAGAILLGLGLAIASEVRRDRRHYRQYYRHHSPHHHYRPRHHLDPSYRPYYRHHHHRHY